MPMGKHVTSAKLIKNAIVDSGKSQMQVASDLGVSDITISRWVNGWRRPSTENLVELARSLGVLVTDLTPNNNEGN